MIMSRLVTPSILSALLACPGLAKADAVFLKCEKYQENNAQGASVIFAKVDVEKKEFSMKTIFDETWKAFKDTKQVDDVIQVQDKRWVDRATGVMKWDFATYQCKKTDPKVF